MGTYSELKIWVNDYSRRIFKDLLLVIREKLQQDSCRTFLRRGWQEGYHYSLIIDISNNKKFKVEKIEKMIENYLQEYPSDNYDRDQFKERFKIISCLEDRFLDPFDIKENNSFLFRDITQNLQSQFENEEQIDIYFQLHIYFDGWFKEFYGESDTDLFLFIGLLFLLGANIPNRTLHESAHIYSNGFVSHLSHYIGFIFSLNKESREKVKVIFEKNYLQERDKFKEYLVKLLLSEQLEETKRFITDFLTLFDHLRDLFNKGKLTYYSPHQRDLRDATMHPSHMAVFQNPELRNLVENDPIVACYRWILSSFYEKLPLLNISPKQKFYMNYFIYHFYRDEMDEMMPLLREKVMIYEEETLS
jgi:hypothetical protein